MLVAEEGFTRSDQFALRRGEDEVMPCLLALKVEVIDGTAIRRGIAHLDIGLEQGRLIEIGAHTLTIVAVAHHLGEAIAQTTQGTDREGRNPTVGGQQDRKAGDLLRSIVRTLWMHAHHPIRQVDGGEGRHQQVADIPHIRVYIVNRILALRSTETHSRAAGEGQSE